MTWTQLPKVATFLARARVVTGDLMSWSTDLYGQLHHWGYQEKRSVRILSLTYQLCLWNTPYAALASAGTTANLASSADSLAARTLPIVTMARLRAATAALLLVAGLAIFNGMQPFLTCVIAAI